MRIVDVREKTVPVSSEIRNSMIDFSQMSVSVVAIVTDQQRDGRPVVGFGFNSNGRYGQAGILRDRLIPRLSAASPAQLCDPETGNLDPAAVWDVVTQNEKPGGHGDRAVAVGAIDMAVWDAVAKAEGKPLHVLLAERFGSGAPSEQVAVYAAGGYYYPGKGVRALQDEMRGYLDAGFTTVKMKIGGAPLQEDLGRIEAVLDLLAEPSALAVDANGRFDLEQTLAYGDALAGYGLHWYEEPCDPLDYAIHAELAARYEGAIASGENLLSFSDFRNLIRYGGLRPDRDILQMDPALSYGLVEYLRVLRMLEESGWSPRQCVPHGGHQLNLNIAAGLRLGGCEAYPEVFQPFGGFADDIPIIDGFVRLPDAPGIGLEEKKNLRPILEELAA